jgi:hypothetical protein
MRRAGPRIASRVADHSPRIRFSFPTSSGQTFAGFKNLGQLATKSQVFAAQDRYKAGALYN